MSDTLLIKRKTKSSRAKIDICFRVSDGIQAIIPPKIIEKLLIVLSDFFQNSYKSIFISNTISEKLEENNILHLPSSYIDRFFYCNVVATKITREGNSNIINIRLAIEESNQQ